MKKVWLSWSTGKDSAWTLYTLKKSRRYKVDALFTTVTEEFSRVSVHGVRDHLLQAQADQLELPLYRAILPWPCSNEIYQNAMEKIWEAAVGRGVQCIAFGDLFLEDIRQYRMDILKNTGLHPIFPIWKQPTCELAATMISSGVQATITCINPRHLPEEFAGRQFDAEFLNELPPGVDPCGENGEFHTFVHAGPMFPNPIHVKAGEVVKRGDFVYSDVIPCK